MTPDIQELKDKALAAADLANHLNGIDPYTILALIEENERLREAAEYYFDASCELGPSHEACGKLHPDQCSGCVARQAMEGPSK